MILKIDKNKDKNEIHEESFRTIFLQTTENILKILLNKFNSTGVYVVRNLKDFCYEDQKTIKNAMHELLDKDLSGISVILKNGEQIILEQWRKNNFHINIQ